MLEDLELIIEVVNGRERILRLNRATGMGTDVMYRLDAHIEGRKFLVTKDDLRGSSEKTTIELMLSEIRQLARLIRGA